MEFRVFVEYYRQFQPVSNENRTVDLVLKIRIYRCINCQKRMEFMWIALPLNVGNLQGENTCALNCTDLRKTRIHVWN